ncbi:MAG: hypothetical protein JW834_03900 [Candidatus Diapherotrites archaeon]|nr:hypothetical protein [Candidatus Diapherotrites archaeon]
MKRFTLLLLLSAAFAGLEMYPVYDMDTNQFGAYFKHTDRALTANELYIDATPTYNPGYRYNAAASCARGVTCWTGLASSKFYAGTHTVKIGVWGNQYYTTATKTVYLTHTNNTGDYTNEKVHDINAFITGDGLIIVDYSVKSCRSQTDLKLYVSEDGVLWALVDSTPVTTTQSDRGVNKAGSFGVQVDLSAFGNGARYFKTAVTGYCFLDSSKISIGDMVQIAGTQIGQNELLYGAEKVQNAHLIGVDSTTISITTSRNAECRASTSNIGFNQMSDNNYIQTTNTGGTTTTMILIPPSNGENTFYIRCRDTYGIETTQPTTINVNRVDVTGPPQLTILTPATSGMEFVKGSSVNVSYQSTSKDISHYEYWVDGNQPTQTSAKSMLLSTTNIPEGTTKTVYVKAVDTSGKSTTKTVAIKVAAPQSTTGIRSGTTPTKQTITPTTSKGTTTTSKYAITRFRFKPDEEELDITPHIVILAITVLTLIVFYRESKK